MRRILTLALLAALALAAVVPVSIVTAGKAEAKFASTTVPAANAAKATRRGR